MLISVIGKLGRSLNEEVVVLMQLTCLASATYVDPCILLQVMLGDKAVGTWKQKTRQKPSALRDALCCRIMLRAEI